LPPIQKFIVSAATRSGALGLLDDVALQDRVDVAEEHQRRVALRLGQPRLEAANTPSLVSRVSREARSSE
jgi:hypothetical protein